MRAQRHKRTGVFQSQGRAPLRLEELEPRIAPVNDLFGVPGEFGAPTLVRIDWMTKEADLVNELGVYVVDDVNGTVDGLAPGAPGYSAAALSRARLTLNRGSGPGANLDTTFPGGTLLGVYLVPGGTTAQAISGGARAWFSFDAANADGIEHVLARPRGDGGIDFSFEDLEGGGDRDFNDAVISVGVTRAVATPGQAGETVPTQFTVVEKEASASHEVGVVVLDGPDGSVDGLTPDDPGYAAAALGNAQVIFRAADVGNTNNLTLPGGAFLGFYILVNGNTEQFLAGNPSNTPGNGPLAYFTFPEANPDGLDHAQYRAVNVLAWEDLLGQGDADFNDVVFQFTFGTSGSDPDIPTQDGPPVATIELVNDTGASDQDGITNDPSLLVSITGDNAVRSVRAGFDGQSPAEFTDLTAELDTDNRILVDRQLATVINGAPLGDGRRTLTVEVEDEAGSLDAFTFTFTLDTSVALSYDLVAEDDTGALGDFRTDRTTVTLTGSTDPGATVVLAQDGREVTAPDGSFSISGLDLAVGPNNVSLTATDLAGNVTRLNRVITRNAPPTVANPIAEQNLSAANPTVGIDLSNVFADTEMFARFETALGNIDVQLFDAQTPQTVANFSNYVNGRDYDDSIFHRLVSGFVLQGGGFDTSFAAVPEDPPVINEPGITNAEGTIAMAKVGGDPNSATSEFFFNLADNSENLDNQNGGFTAFGQIANGQAVLDQLAGLPTSNQSAFNSAFGNLPLRPGADTTNFPANTTPADLALINAVRVLANSGLTFTVVSNSNPALVSTTLQGTTLRLTLQAGQTGTADITVRATDLDGSVVESTFTVNGS